MSRVFADTYYFLGLLNRSDESHEGCAAFARQYRGELVTTAYVLTELADALLAPHQRLRTAEFIRALQANRRVEIWPGSPELFESGLALYSARPDKEWSLTDCISFVVMRQAGLRDALTGDHHFEQASFVALLK